MYPDQAKVPLQAKRSGPKEGEKANTTTASSSATVLVNPTTARLPIGKTATHAKGEFVSATTERIPLLEEQSEPQSVPARKIAFLFVWEAARRWFARAARRLMGIHYCIGMMVGTSHDSVDWVLVRMQRILFWKRAPKVLKHQSYPFPGDLRAALRRLTTPAVPETDEEKKSFIAQITREVQGGFYKSPIKKFHEERGILNFSLGIVFGEQAKRFVAACGLWPEDITLIASVGVTEWHSPEMREQVIQNFWGPGEHLVLRTSSTEALGEPSAIAQYSRILTIGELRKTHVSAGGQGAPLVRYAHGSRSHSSDLGICYQNIGGIANVTYAPPNGKPRDAFAFDTGPGNMMIDELVRRMTASNEPVFQELYDRDGWHASQGTVLQEVLDWLFAHPYIAKEPPKTTGREEFGSQFVDELFAAFPAARFVDLIATATEFTARSIVYAYRDWVLPRGPIHEIRLLGGGANNTWLVARISALVHEIIGSHVKVVKDTGNQTDEALAMAVIGWLAYRKCEVDVPGPESTNNAILGKFCYPPHRTWKEKFKDWKQALLDAA